MLRRKRFGSVKVWIPVGGALTFMVVAGLHWFSKNSYPTRVVSEVVEKKDRSADEKRTPSSASKSKSVSYPVFKDTKPGDACPQIEWGGCGPSSVPSRGEWKNFMAVYHGVKKDLAQWVGAQSGSLTPETMKVLEERVASIRVERPPTPTEPDLSWRGQVVLSKDIDGKPLLRVGGGFLAFMRTAPERARFELTRAMLHNWSPCSLKGTAAAGTWHGFTKCQGVEGSAACDVGGFDESSWAVSSAVAALVAPPKCKVPALVEKSCAVVSKGVALR
jgi:hypothetical protein